MGVKKRTNIVCYPELKSPLSRTLALHPVSGLYRPGRCQGPQEQVPKSPLILSLSKGMSGQYARLVRKFIVVISCLCALSLYGESFLAEPVVATEKTESTDNQYSTLCEKTATAIAKTITASSDLLESIAQLQKELVKSAERMANIPRLSQKRLKKMKQRCERLVRELEQCRQGIESKT